MPLIKINLEEEKSKDQYINGLGYISRNGENFLPSIVRLQEVLDGKFREEDEKESKKKVKRRRFLFGIGKLM